VYREDDKTTVWFRENVRERMRNRPDVIFATILFRWFNRIETGERLLKHGIFDDFDLERAYVVLQGVKPVVGPAYMIKSVTGMDKLSGVLWAVNNALQQRRHLITHVWQPQTLRSAWLALCELPEMGPFMAYEVVTDLAHTDALCGAEDLDTWANPGPGCARGLGRLKFGNPDAYPYPAGGREPEILGEMAGILAYAHENWKLGPKWRMREVEHTLCEYDKYWRVREGGRMKRLYR
jgi:hypothetical protein